jgi:hypothetical protein
LNPEVPLAQRPNVRRAATAFARVLMKEGRVRPSDLEARDAAPVSQVDRQLVTPNKVGPKPGGGPRQRQIFDALRDAGDQGLSIHSLMALTGKTLRSLHSTMWGYEVHSQVWRRRVGQVLHYVLTEAFAPQPGVAVQKGELPPHQVKQPKKPRPPKAPKAAKQPKPKREMNAAQLGLVAHLASSVPASKQRLQRDQEVIVPANVKRTIAPPVNHDLRYQVDATQFKGGELMAEWRKARAGRR